MCPLIREIMHTTNDIPMDVNELVSKYAPGQEICHGLVFDFSMLVSTGADPNLWTLNAMSNVTKKKLYYDMLVENADENGNTSYEVIK